MYGDKNNSMQCVEFDALLADALDGVLAGPRLESFEQHKKDCATCATMFAETESGMNWMSALDEVDPPRMLVHNILAATTGTAVATGMAEVAARRPLWQRIRDRFSPAMAPMFTPRFAMSFGMAFFSITLVINVSGLKVASLRHLDLTPTGIQKTYYETVVRSYENIRLVYEIESRVRELKRATDDGSYKDQKQQGPTKQQQQEKKQENNSREPDLRQYQNYSRETNSTLMARASEMTWQQAVGRRDV